MSSLSRRHFLNSSLGFAAAMSAGSVLAQDADPAAAAAPPEAPKEAEAAPAEEEKPKKKPREGPDDRLRFAVIGCGGRGASHVDDLLNLADHVNLVALCDPDEAHATAYATRVEDETGERPKVYTDVRKLLEDKDIHAVTIATPNHWHTLGAIWAMQAGKDVYVEKPVSHNVSEGRRAAQVARKYKQICQTGTQSRSNPGMRQAIEFIQSGKIGDVKLARGLCYKRRGSIGMKGEYPVPPNVDYDLWCGPAPMDKVTRPKFHYDWHWIWNYGNGDLGNQGIHQMDIARWGLGKNEFPKSVQASGGRLGYKDQGETPNTELVAFEFDDCLLQFEVRGLPTNDEAGAKIGVIFYGTEGIVSITSYTNWQSYLGPDLKKGPGGNGGGDHFANFLKAVHSRDVKHLTADIEEGHLSSAYCHLGNISYRLGRKLQINSSSESFVNDAEADAMLTRPYREPFVVPAKV